MGGGGIGWQGWRPLLKQEFAFLGMPGITVFVLRKINEVIQGDRVKVS